MIETTLFDFDENRIIEQKKQNSEKQKIMDYLGKFSVNMLKDELRKNGGHPKPAWGNKETWRSYYLEECSRRGIKLLSAIGWSANENSLYVNIHSGCVEALLDIATMKGYFADRYTISSQVWSVIEHWEPYDPAKPNHYKIKYLEEKIEHLKNEIQNNNSRSTLKFNKIHLEEAIKDLKNEKT